MHETDPGFDPERTVEQYNPQVIPDRNDDVINPDLERFIGLPNTKNSIRAKDSDGLTIFLNRGIAKKLYTCMCCRGQIEIGESHVVMGRVQKSKRYNHHHIDSECTQTTILPRLTEITIIPAKQATVTKINKKSRRYRYRHR